MNCIITFDLEEPRHSNITNSARAFRTAGFDESVGKLLKLLRDHRARATFFVVGETAEAYPDTIRRISDAGHEIAGHSMRHKRIVEMTEEEFRSDARLTKDVLERITGSRVVGYRAPSWSAHTKRTPWFWRVLKEEGYSYSSSIVPLRNFLYGESDVVLRTRETILGRLEALAAVPEDGVVEIPVSTVRIARWRIPLGGFYFRMLPWILLRRGGGQGRDVMWYFHLRDIGLEQSSAKGLPLHERVIQFGRIRAGEKKFKRVLALSRGTKA